MAYLSKSKTGNFRIRVTVEGKEKEFVIPTADKKQASTIVNMAGRLEAYRKTGEPDRLLSNWLPTIPDWLRKKLERVGLLETSTNGKTLADLQSLIDKLPGAANTKHNRNHWFKILLQYKPGTYSIKDFTRENALEFCSFIRTKYKAGESSERLIRGIKTFFRKAVQNEWISRNPFEFCSTSSRASTKKVSRITEADLQTVLQSTHNPKWKCIIGLMRLCGLRGANEIRNLDWSIDSIRFATIDNIGSITIRPTKQERLENRRERIIPLPPLMEKLLLDWQEASRANEKENFPFVPMFPEEVSKLLDKEKKGQKIEINLNTPIKKIFNRAGVPLTCAYDLRKNCCSDWLTPDKNGNTIDIVIYEQMAGHTIDIGRKYYQQLFPDRLEKGFEQVSKRWEAGKTSIIDTCQESRNFPRIDPEKAPVQMVDNESKKKQESVKEPCFRDYLQNKKELYNFSQSSIYPQGERNQARLNTLQDNDLQETGLDLIPEFPPETLIIQEILKYLIRLNPEDLTGILKELESRFAD